MWLLLSWGSISTLEAVREEGVPCGKLGWSQFLGIDRLETGDGTVVSPSDFLDNCSLGFMWTSVFPA